MMVNRLLLRAGLSIRRVAPIKTLYSPETETKGRIVELVGPAAIGKTTLFKTMSHQLGKAWLFEHHTRIDQTLNCAKDGLNDALRNVYFERVKKLSKSNSDVIATSKIIVRMSEVVRMSLMAASGKFPRGFFFDEGIGHFFAEQIIALNDDQQQKIIDHLAMIFTLPTNIDTLIARRLSRLSLETPSAQAHQQAIKVQAERELCIYHELLSICSRRGVPHLILSAEQSVEENGDQITNFLGSLLKAPPGPIMRAH